MLKYRLMLALLVYIMAFIAFPNVWDTVAYMYIVEVNLSYLECALCFSFIAVLVLVTNFKITIYRHAFDTLILGILTPVSVMTSLFEGFDILTSFNISLSILITALSIKYFHSTRFFASLRNGGEFGLSIKEVDSIYYVLFAIIFAYLVFRFHSDFTFDLWSVFIRTYEIRAEKQVDGLPGYFLGWFVSLFFPVLLANGIKDKSYTLIFISFFSAFFIFQVLAVKVIFLNYILLLCFGIAYVYYEKINTFTPFYFYLILLFLAIIFEDDSYNMLMDRFFFLIGTNTLFYFDYYSINPLRFFTGTKLDFGLVEYIMEPGIQIDMVYYQGYGTNQSAGYMANMYANLGIAGILLSGLLIGPIMVMIHSISTKSDALAYLFMVALATSLINASFTMLFLSNGLIVVLLTSFLLKKPISENFPLEVK